MPYFNPIKPTRPPSSAARDTTPVILTTGATPLTIALTAGVPGPQVNLPTLDLMNSLRVPIEITELCFAVDQPSDAFIEMLHFDISLSIGPYPITFGFCPVAAIAPRREMSPFEYPFVGPPPATALVADQLRWVLPRPLLVHPSEGFSGAVRLNPRCAPYQAAPQTGNLHFSMTARGRRCPNGTALSAGRAIPHASGFTFRLFDGADANLTAPDVAFKNPHRSILHVSSINNRRLDSASTANTGTIIINGPGGLANSPLRQVASNASAPAVFGQRCAIEELHDLNPNEAYSVALSANTVGGANAAVGLTGWREEM